jgi:uncharacterized membrane protein YgdD (TMEM256/DUF423 family)
VNRLGLAAALTGLAGVALGAFGAHGLSLNDEALGWWQTTTLYTLFHAVDALAIALSNHTKQVQRGE